MKRQVTRTKILPAYRLDKAEIGVLWVRIVNLFNDAYPIYCNLSIELTTETLNFFSFEEFEACIDLPPKITKFSFRFAQDERNISIQEGFLLLDSRPQVSANGETESWCAGAVETVYTFISQHKAPYDWFIRAPLGWMLALLACGTVPGLILLTTFILPELRVPHFALSSWLALVVTLGILYILRDSLFPITIITIRETNGYMQRFATELTITIAFLSVILTVIGWFV